MPEDQQKKPWSPFFRNTKNLTFVFHMLSAFTGQRGIHNGVLQIHGCLATSASWSYGEIWFGETQESQVKITAGFFCLSPPFVVWLLIWRLFGEIIVAAFWRKHLTIKMCIYYASRFHACCSLQNSPKITLQKSRPSTKNAWPHVTTVVECSTVL